MAAELKFLINAVDNASATLGKIGRETEKLGGATAKLNAASRLLGAGAIIAFGAASVKAYAEAEASQIKLQEAYRKFPAVADVSIQSMRDLNSAIQAKTGSDDDELAAAEAKLAMYNLTGSQIQKLIPIVNDYAIANGIGVTEAAGKVGKAMLGNAKALKDVGIDFKATGDKAKDFDAIYTALEGKVGGAGEAFGESTAGQLKILQASFSDLQEEVGAQLVPALKTLVDVATPLLGAFGKLPEPVKSVTVLLGAAAAATLLLGPRLITLGTALQGILPAGAKAAAGLEATTVAAGTSATATNAATVSVRGLMASFAALAAAATAAIAVTVALGEANKALQDAMGNGAKSTEQWGQSTRITSADLAQLKLDMVQVGGQSGTLAAAIKYLGSGDVIGAWTAMRTGGENVANFDSAMATLVGSGNLDEAAAMVAALGLSTDDARDKLPAYTAALDAAGGAANGMTGPTQTAAQALDDVASKGNGAEDAVKALRDALDGLRGTQMDSERATMSVQAAIDKANASFTEHGKTLSYDTDAGRANRQSLMDLAKASLDAAVAYAQNGESTASITLKTREAREEFVKTAIKMGYSSDMANHLADSYGLIPSSVSTAVEASGIDIVKQKVIEYIATLNNIPAERRTQIIEEYIREERTVRYQRAGGGYISGPGTSTSDSIPAMLSNGEYVIRAAAVSRAGIGLLSDLNDDGVINRARFATGGFASPAAGLAALQRDTAALVAAQQQLTQLRTGRASTIGGYASMGNAFNFGGSGEAAANLQAAQEAVNMARTPAERVAALAKLDQAKAAARDAAPTAGNLLKGLKAKLGDIKSFYTSLKELRKRGLPLSLLQQVVEAGPLEGSQMAKALLSASPKDFAEIIATQGQIEQFSKASAEYDPLVIRQRGVVNAAVTRARRDATFVSSVRIDLDGKQVAAALLAYKKAMGNRPLGLG